MVLHTNIAAHFSTGMNSKCSKNMTFQNEYFNKLLIVLQTADAENNGTKTIAGFCWIDFS